MKAEFVVIGSGIAACAAMLYLKQCNQDVLQIAPQEKQTPKIGETLSSSANRLLKELQVWDAFLEQGYLVSDTVFSAWQEPTLHRQSKHSPTQGPNWSIDRNGFETFLRQQCSSDSSLRYFNKVRNCHPSEEGFELELDNQLSVKTRFLIDCSGRAAVAGSRLGKRYRIDNMLCFYNFLSQTDTDVEPTVGVMTEAVSNGWWYSAILPENKMVLSFYTYPDLVNEHLGKNIDAWIKLMNDAPLTCERIHSAGFSVTEPPLTSDAGMVIQTEMSGERWIVAGDAMASLDPLSSHGMTQALWSGLRAAQAMMKYKAGDRSLIQELDETMTQALAAYQIELRQKYQQVGRFAEQPFWQRRVGLNDRNDRAS